MVGQLGGYRQGDAGSVAAWWDLTSGAWGTIVPNPTSAATWTRMISVSELVNGSLLAVLQSTREDFCPSVNGTTCGTTGTMTVWVSSVLLDPRLTTVAPPVMDAPDLPTIVCSESADQRDVWIDPATSDVTSIGAGRLDLDVSGVVCSSQTSTCESLVVGWAWPGSGTAILDDYDPMPTASHLFGSSGRGIAKDGAFVGWGYAPDGQPEGGMCMQSPLFWPDSTTFEDIRSAIVGVGDNPVRAEGCSEGPTRFVAGWDDFADEPILWRRDVSGSWDAWRLDVAADPDGIFIDSNCTATLSEGHDVSADGWMVATGRDGSGVADERVFVLIPTDRACAGDVDFDGDVDTIDLLEVLAAFGPCPGCTRCPADLVADSVVDFSDILAVLGSWGDCTTLDAVPQTVQDCFTKFGSDTVALEACLEAVAAQNGGN